MAVTVAGGRRIEVSNPDKVLFPDVGLTKRGLMEHYARIAGRMVPHLRGRALVMERFPDGIGEAGFIQKERGAHFPEWVGGATLPKEGGTVTHVVCNDEATLVYLAGQACITPHTWLSRVDRPERPDEVVLDLDPPGRDASAVPVAARALRRLLEELGLAGFPKSTGSRGVHVHVPIERDVGFDEARALARAIARILSARHPRRLTMEARKAQRRGRLYVDAMRNSYAQHAVAPFAVRARPGAPVATPLDWDEAGSRRFDPGRITVANLFRRLAQKEDPWAGMGSARARVAEALPAAEALAGEAGGR